MVAVIFLSHITPVYTGGGTRVFHRIFKKKFFFSKTRLNLELIRRFLVS